MNTIGQFLYKAKKDGLDWAQESLDNTDPTRMQRSAVSLSDALLGAFTFSDTGKKDYWIDIYLSILTEEL